MKFCNFLFPLNRQPRVNTLLRHALVKQTTLLLKYQQVKHPGKTWTFFWFIPCVLELSFPDNKLL